MRAFPLLTKIYIHDIVATGVRFVACAIVTTIVSTTKVRNVDVSSTVQTLNW